MLYTSTKHQEICRMPRITPVLKRCVCWACEMFQECSAHALTRVKCMISELMPCPSLLCCRFSHPIKAWQAEGSRSPAPGAPRMVAKPWTGSQARAAPDGPAGSGLEPAAAQWQPQQAEIKALLLGSAMGAQSAGLGAPGGSGEPDPKGVAKGHGSALVAVQRSSSGQLRTDLNHASPAWFQLSLQSHLNPCNMSIILEFSLTRLFQSPSVTEVTEPSRAGPLANASAAWLFSFSWVICPVPLHLTNFMLLIAVPFNILFVFSILFLPRCVPSPTLLLMIFSSFHQ